MALDRSVHVPTFAPKPSRSAPRNTPSDSTNTARPVQSESQSSLILALRAVWREGSAREASVLSFIRVAQFRAAQTQHKHKSPFLPRSNTSPGARPRESHPQLDALYRGKPGHLALLWSRYGVRMAYVWCTDRVRMAYGYCTDRVRMVYAYCTDIVRMAYVWCTAREALAMIATYPIANGQEPIADGRWPVARLLRGQQT